MNPIKKFTSIFIIEKFLGGGGVSKKTTFGFEDFLIFFILNFSRLVCNIENTSSQGQSISQYRREKNAKGTTCTIKADQNATDTWRVLIQPYQRKENIQVLPSPTFLLVKTVLNSYLRCYVLLSSLKTSNLSDTRNTLIEKFDLVLQLIYQSCS